MQETTSTSTVPAAVSDILSDAVVTVLMGYFLFVGPLAMYYAGEHPAAVEQPPFDRQELLDALNTWQANVASSIPGKRDWTEGYGMRYLFANMGTDAFGALMLKISCYITGEEMPAEIPRGWRFYESETIDRAMSSEGSVPSFLIADIFIPSPEVGAARCPGPAGNEVTLTTTGTLRHDLVALNSVLWNASEADMLSWSDSPPAAGEFLDTERNARFAFSLFLKALLTAEANSLPIVVGH